MSTQLEQELPAPRLRRGFKVTVLVLHQWLWPCVLFVPFSANLLVAALCLAFLLVMGVEMGHHRYFAHRSFKCSRVFQFILGVWATAAFQRDVLWWASMHRVHHRYSDKPGDPHTPYKELGGGFWHAYINWGIDHRYADPNYRMIKDLLQYPELRWLGRWHYLVNIIYASLCFTLGALNWVGESGLHTLVWLYILPHIMAQNIISSQGAFAHGVPRLPGSYRPFDIGDKSLNHILLGVFTTGGGFHNNHHRFPNSARLGLLPKEIDLTYIALRGFEMLGLVRDIHIPSAAIRYRNERIAND